MLMDLPRAALAGVARAIDILRSEMERTLKLLGCASISSLDRSYVNLIGKFVGTT